MADLTTYGAISVQGLTLEKLLRVMSDATWKPTAVSCSGTISADTIAEYTGAAGVTIDGVLIKDNETILDNAKYYKTKESGSTVRGILGVSGTDVLYVGAGAGNINTIQFRLGAAAFASMVSDALKIDTINEFTGAAGVTIDGVVVKDGGIELTNAAGTTSITYIATNDGVSADPTTDTPENWLEVHDGSSALYIPCYTIGGA